MHSAIYLNAFSDIIARDSPTVYQLGFETTHETDTSSLAALRLRR